MSSSIGDKFARLLNLIEERYELQFNMRDKEKPEYKTQLEKLNTEIALLDSKINTLSQEPDTIEAKV